MKALVLFDFDGTLADTAPDLAAAANRQRQRRGLPALPLTALRPYASHGARGLLHAALGMTPEDPGYASARMQFLDDYVADMTRHTRLFPGVTGLLARLDAEQIAWGIVTNKASSMAVPLIAHLGLAQACRPHTLNLTPNPCCTQHAAPVIRRSNACTWGMICAMFRRGTLPACLSSSLPTAIAAVRT